MGCHATSLDFLLRWYAFTFGTIFLPFFGTLIHTDPFGIRWFQIYVVNFRTTITKVVVAFWYIDRVVTISVSCPGFISTFGQIGRNCCPKYWKSESTTHKKEYFPCMYLQSCNSGTKRLLILYSSGSLWPLTLTPSWTYDFLDKVDIIEDICI